MYSTRTRPQFIEGGKIVAVSQKSQQRSKRKSLVWDIANFFYWLASTKFVHTLFLQMRRYGIWRSVGVFLGSAILFLSLGNPADAQAVLFAGAEAAVTAAFTPFLPDAGIIVLIFATARFLIFAGILGLAAMAAVEGSRGGNWQPWVNAVASLAAVVAVLQGASMMIFGVA